MGEAEIKLGLNEDLTIGQQERRRGVGGVVLDDCNFHESAEMENFEKDRSLSIVAPDGEVGGTSLLSRFHTHLTFTHTYIVNYFQFQFTLMNYRVTGEFLNSIPFRVYTTIEEGDLPKSLRLCVRLKSDITQKT